MKIYVVAGAIALSLVLVVSAAMLLSQEDEPAPQPQTIVSSSTQATDENSPDSTSDSTSQEQASNIMPGDNKATYTKFSADAFRAAAGKERILFFYDSAHTPSKRLDEMLSASLKDLPNKLRIFKVNFAEQKELGEQFGVTEPGASLKFDTNSQLSAVYIATDNPDIATYKKVLSLE